MFQHLSGSKEGSAYLPEKIRAVHCKELRGLQGLREVALMNHSSQSMSQDKASGSLPGQQVETKGAVHNLPTARQVHANQGNHRNT